MWSQAESRLNTFYLCDLRSIILLVLSFSFLTREVGIVSDMGQRKQRLAQGVPSVAATMVTMEATLLLWSFCGGVLQLFHLNSGERCVASLKP